MSSPKDLPQRPFRSLWDLDCACSDLTNGERALAQLASYFGGKTQRFFLSQTVIVAMLQSSESTVRRAQKGLVKKGLMVRVADWSPGRSIEFKLTRNRQGERALFRAAAVRAEQKAEADAVDEEIEKSLNSCGDSAPVTDDTRSKGSDKPVIPAHQTPSPVTAHALKKPNTPEGSGPPNGSGAAPPGGEETHMPSKPDLLKVRPPQSQARRHSQA